MNKDRKWYIVYTPEGKELKTLYALKKKHFECFCPLSKPTVKVGNHDVATPVFPNYIFVYALRGELAAIKQLSGIVNVMYWLNEYIVVNEEDIFTLKKLTEDYELLTVENIRINTINPGSKLWEHNDIKNRIDIEDADTVKVSFPAYGFSVTAKENKMNIRVININAKKNKSQLPSLEYIK